MNLFRVRGIQLAVHISFFVLLGINAFAGWQDGGYAGMFWHTAALLVSIHNGDSAATTPSTTSAQSCGLVQARALAVDSFMAVTSEGLLRHH